MPTFNASPFAAQPVKLTPGKPEYVFGSWDEKIAPTKLLVTAVQSTAILLTYYVTLNEGNVPVTGSLFTVYGLATNAQFNLTNALVGTVTLNAAGVGTITFVTTGATVYAKTADGGEMLIPQSETGDIVANGQSVPVGLPYTVPQDAYSGVIAVGCEVNFPVITGLSCVVALQWALTNTPATAWQVAIANVVTVASGTATYGTTQWSGKANFLRYSISGTTNASSATICAKLGI